MLKAPVATVENEDQSCVPLLRFERRGGGCLRTSSTKIYQSPSNVPWISQLWRSAPRPTPPMTMQTSWST
eukprot:1047260-Pelagomonas_calceolata.AAC.5